ncbi:penicillin acylase family protein [Massilia agilis]|uniref:Penicillin acylase family protein n=1 Tax=Massilia agilis TaxID=1811226 RepID=A0ABT2DHN9_9BURK|nr:penicillin acylase family protein [Massilia agilis]
MIICPPALAARSASLARPFLILAAMALAACSPEAEGSATVPAPQPAHAELARTSHGVVHVRAQDFRGLGYGIAYAYAEDNLCMFADSLLTVRGERSQFFGPDAHATKRVKDEYGAASDFVDLKNEDSDFFFKGYLDPAELAAGYAAASVESRDFLEGYAAGYNRYLKDRAGHYPAACNNVPWVRPITAQDMYLVLAEKALHASGEVFAAEIVAGAVETGKAVTPVAVTSIAHERDFMQERLDELTGGKLGSNALALGKEVTANGRGVLLGNPHYPWTSTDRFYQAHLTVPGRYDAMGVILGGIPLVVIGFNRDVAWTHTVTTAVHFTTFRLQLDPADPTHTTYLFDGKPMKMTSRTVKVDSLQPDGTRTSRSKTFYFSKQGVVLVKPEAGLGWTSTSVTVLADPNRNNTRLLDQWIGIGTARNVHELKAALDRTVGLPWVNTIAADRFGETLYADASVVPRVGTDKFASDCLLVPQLLTFDGARSACGWGKDPGGLDGIFAPQNAPWMIRTDYVANSNDSYWLTNARALLAGPAPLGFSPLYGKTGIEQKLRTRIGFRQLEEELRKHKPLGLEDVQRLAFANRVHAAELVLPQLLPTCKDSRDRTILAACKALSAWDRRAELASRGAVLFREFWNSASAIPGKWAVPFDPADPVNTPSGVASQAMPAMLGALKQAAQKLQGLGIPLDAPLGQYQEDTRNGARVAVHGAIGDIDGSYNSIHMASQLDASGYHNIAWGTSYVQAVTFDEDGPVARAMLVYGQSVDPQSPWYADQVPLFSQKQWPALPFTEAAIHHDPRYSVHVLND